MERRNNITELITDTPDTDCKSEYEYLNNKLEIKYNVQNLSSNENDADSNDTSSSDDDLSVVAGAIAAVACKATLEPCMTDQECSESSSVAEIVIHRIDYNLCLQCKLRNDNPLFRYCKKCFQFRKSFLPPRPRGFKKKCRKGGVKRKRSTTSSPELTKYDDITTLTSNTSNSDSIEKVYKKKTNNELITSTLVDQKELCIICNIESKNSIFLHGSTAHMCCCYKCAIKSWKQNKKCPACNEKANNVVKVFVS